MSQCQQVGHSRYNTVSLTVECGLLVTLGAHGGAQGSARKSVKITRRPRSTVSSDDGRSLPFGSHRWYKPQPYSLSLPVSISARNMQCYLFLSRPSWESIPVVFSYFLGNSVSLWLIHKTMWLGILLCSVWICGHAAGEGVVGTMCLEEFSLFKLQGNSRLPCDCWTPFPPGLSLRKDRGSHIPQCDEPHAPRERNIEKYKMRMELS